MSEDNGIYRPIAPDWSKVDWQKTNNVLDIELNVPVSVVSFYRSAVGIKRRVAGSIDWKSLDWSKNNQQLSFENKVSVAKVKLLREVLGHPLPESPNGAHGNRIVTEDMIKAVRWELSKDVELAREWHVSRERVRQLRQERGLPVCQINGLVSATKDFQRWMLENRESIEGKLAHVVAELCPITLDRARKYDLMRKSSIPFEWTPFRKSSAATLPINWDIPNNILASIWDHNHNWPANNRCRYAKSEPKWSHLVPSKVNTADLVNSTPELRDAIYLEIGKVEKLGITPRWGLLESFGITKERQVA